eukprot:CAMPEP_0194373886 /NCGR_PEP_ID=MMETSP0174-20130528/22284_1 /TAXON_ID=216777 /ORGANISM="Proboscia alata, Strain PI-D3" /LENGTH=523 /DNA_ID=CAMNT_0039153165 /DNA_START=42 /DNA_END=1613 /DNA_ORIENTATION=-
MPSFAVLLLVLTSLHGHTGNVSVAASQSPSNNNNGYNGYYHPNTDNVDENYHNNNDYRYRDQEPNQQPLQQPELDGDQRSQHQNLQQDQEQYYQSYNGNDEGRFEQAQQQQNEDPYRRSEGYYPSGNRGYEQQYEQQPPTQQQENTYQQEQNQYTHPGQSVRTDVPMSSSLPARASAARPIHYQFKLNKQDQDGDVDNRERTRGDSNNDRNIEANDDTTISSSPKRDAITRYIATTHGGRYKIAVSSATVGMGLGAFLGKSITNKPKPFATVCSVVFCVPSLLHRGSVGEMTRAIGLATLFALQRTGRIRRLYSTGPHLSAILVPSKPRQPFPPIIGGNENPWKYETEYEDDIQFQMLYSVAVMAFAGSICVGNMPLIPTWIGSMAGAAAFAFVTTLKSAKGDLARTMGMKVVAFVQEMVAINSELSVLSKTSVVCGKIFDKLMVLDRKHSIKDRLLSMLRWLYEKISRAANQVQSDIQDSGDNDIKETSGDNNNGSTSVPLNRLNEFEKNRPIYKEQNGKSS